MAKKFFIEITDPEKNKTHISEFNQSEVFNSIEACQTFLDDNFVVDNKNNLVVRYWETEQVANGESGNRNFYLGIDGRQAIELQKGIDIYLPYENNDQNHVSVSNWVICVGSGPAVPDKIKNKYIFFKDNKALVNWTDNMSQELRPEAVLRLYALRSRFPVLENIEGNNNNNNNNNIHNLDNPQSVWKDQKEITEYRLFTEGKGGVEIYENKPHGFLGWLVKSLLTWQKFKTRVSIAGVLNQNLIKNITIPAAINGKPVKSIKNHVFYRCVRLNGVVLPKSLTSIGRYAFKGCIGLTDIVIPDSVKTIGFNAFCECTNLNNVVLPKFLTSIEKRLFEGCMNLKNIIIPDSVTSIGHEAFRGCAKLKNIIIPGSVTSIGDCTFRGCAAFTNIVIPDSVTSIGSWAFSDCSGLINVEIPSSVTFIGQCAFEDCVKLKIIVVNTTTPPFSQRDVFYNNAPDRKIFVPKKALDDYKQVWSDFKDDIFPVE